MTAPVFLVGSGTLPQVGELVTVSDDEGRHAVTVRRLQVGEAVELVDGDGVRATGIVHAVRPPDGLDVLVEQVVAEPAPCPRLVVVQALAKGDRGEVAVETLTEVGVDVVVPWAAQRCVVRWRGDKAERGLARWRRTAREAAKQARRSRLVDVRPLADTAEVAALLAGSAAAVVLHEQAGIPLTDVDLPAAGDIVLVVGPEGGIGEGELADLTAAGARCCGLGPTVLRTSTAGTAAAAVVLAAVGRWS